MTKKSISTVREELRVLNTAAADNSSEQDWITPEFISMATAVVVNLITAATLIGWVEAHHAQELVNAATAVIAGLGAVSANALIVWKYLTSRAEVKAQQINAQYRYMESIAIERMRADRAGS
jgi:hypothetical protein